jgi:hypothetical protein
MLNWIFCSINNKQHHRRSLRLTLPVPVHDFEVEPLRVPLGVDVILEPQVVLDVVHLYGATQVASLEPRIEQQQVVLLRHVYRVGVRRLPRQERLVVRMMVKVGGLSKGVISLRCKLREMLE